MEKKTFVLAAGIVFLFAAILHLGRVFLGWDLVIGEYTIHPAISVIAAVIVGYLSLQGFKHSGKL